MAKTVETTKVAPATNGTTKTETTTERKPTVKRTADELKSTEVGKITIIIGTAMKLANDPKNNLEGIDGIDKKGKEGKAQLSGRMHSITKKDGKLAAMDAKSESYAKLKKFAQDAMVELKAKNYGKAVKGLLSYCLKEVATVSNKTFNPSVLDGIEL